MKRLRGDIGWLPVIALSAILLAILKPLEAIDRARQARRRARLADAVDEED